MNSFILTVYTFFVESNWNLARHPQAAEAAPLPAQAGKRLHSSTGLGPAENGQGEEETWATGHRFGIHCHNS